jgi:hypothetical protein
MHTRRILSAGTTQTYGITYTGFSAWRLAKITINAAPPIARLAKEFAKCIGLRQRSRH